MNTSSQYWQVALKISGSGDVTTSLTVELWDLAKSPYPEVSHRRRMRAVRPPDAGFPLHPLQVALDLLADEG